VLKYGGGDDDVYMKTSPMEISTVRRLGVAM
jgi:hypothetical protein